MTDMSKSEFVDLLKSIAAGQADTAAKLDTIAKQPGKMDDTQFTELKGLLNKSNPPAPGSDSLFGFLDDFFK